MKEKIFLIHGYTANPEANWFPWLKAEVKKQLKQEIAILKMPNPEAPVPQAWDAYCHSKIAHSDGITIIGHSLGCIEALRFVDQHELKEVRLILVSGFDETTAWLPELASFTEKPLHYAELLPKIKQAVVISAIDDDIIPYHYSETLARHLHCKFILLPEGKHFIDRDGVLSLPTVMEELINKKD
ncbi:RBBP9/YdeN family alpha/beta hydrolase [Enterococcus sp. UD-01]|jgi:predicted alpha/beta hydrolase family esterase|uniref:RBBP9/YdeN family alpha/beta hydrolase n=1 Tax=Enterococcus sp. UD-01 TaxID=3373911 RepID=UPI0038325C70